MFILDDSGSMHWEGMPDELAGYGGENRLYAFPPPSHVYGGPNYFNGSERILSFDDSSGSITA